MEALTVNTISRPSTNEIPAASEPDASRSGKREPPA